MKKFRIMIALALVLLMIPIVLGGTISRGVSDSTPNSGDTVTVTLIVDAVQGDKAFVVHEEAPSTITGLSSNIYEFVIIDQLQIADTVKTYTFTAGATGTKTFSGKYTVNGGADQSIGGVQSINVGGTCSPGAWSPLASTVCSGTLFTQSNGCGTQQATGTSDCQASPPSSETCEFWEKQGAVECELNIGLFVVGFFLLFMLKFIGGK